MEWVQTEGGWGVQKLFDQSEVSIRSGYGLGTHWVHSYMAWDIMGAYA